MKQAACSKGKTREMLTDDYLFGTSMTKDRSTMHPKFDLTGVRTHDLQIMTVNLISTYFIQKKWIGHGIEHDNALSSTFNVTEMPALTARSSVTKNTVVILTPKAQISKLQCSYFP